MSDAETKPESDPKIHLLRNEQLPCFVYNSADGMVSVMGEDNGHPLTNERILWLLEKARNYLMTRSR